MSHQNDFLSLTTGEALSALPLDSWHSRVRHVFNPCVLGLAQKQLRWQIRGDHVNRVHVHAKETIQSPQHDDRGFTVRHRLPLQVGGAGGGRA